MNNATENVFSESEIFLILLKIFGLFPMSNDVSGDGKFKIKVNNVIFSLLTLTLLITSFVLNIIDEERNLCRESIKLRSWCITIEVEFLCHIFLFFYQIHKRQNVVKFLMQIERADKEVNIYKKKIYSKLRIKLNPTGSFNRNHVKTQQSKE